MAGMGPAPKDPSQRRRANTPARGEWTDLAPIDKPILPDLPLHAPDGEPWRPGTRRAWAAWREDPVSAQWSPSEISHAWDTIELHNDMSAKTASEVRLRMDGLGLTPKGKRDLRYRVVETAPTAEKPAPKASKSTAARRSRLTVIK